MEAQDLDFEARLRALERLSGGESRGGAASLDSQRSRAGGVVAVMVRVLRQGGEGGRSRKTSFEARSLIARKPRPLGVVDLHFTCQRAP
jgi:hypothetical protein